MQPYYLTKREKSKPFKFFVSHSHHLHLYERALICITKRISNVKANFSKKPDKKIFGLMEGKIESYYIKFKFNFPAIRLKILYGGFLFFEKFAFSKYIVWKDIVSTAVMHSAYGSNFISPTLFFTSYVVV